MKQMKKLPVIIDSIASTSALYCPHIKRGETSMKKLKHTLPALVAAAAVNVAAAGENVAQNSIAVDVRRPVPVVDAKVGGFWHDEYRLLVTK